MPEYGFRLICIFPNIIFGSVLIRVRGNYGSEETRILAFLSYSTQCYDQARFDFYRITLIHYLPYPQPKKRLNAKSSVNSES